MGLKRLWMVMGSLACLVGQPAWCAEDIVDVLQRSQDQRLQAQPPAAADSPRAAIVRRSFQTVLDGLPTARPAVELRVVTGPLVAETLHGRVILANENLADMPETARLFILAHELGHVSLQHWQRVAALYRKWIPGEVTPERTDPVAGALGREASLQAHEHEFSADAYAGRLLQRMGRSDEELVSMFRFLGLMNDTATHPGTRKRMAYLRAGLAASPESNVGD